MPHGGEQAARIAAARRRVKRAAGFLRDAAADLSVVLSEGGDTIGVVHVVDDATARSAADLVRVAHARHGDVDVVILARPHDAG